MSASNVASSFVLAGAARTALATLAAAGSLLAMFVMVDAAAAESPGTRPEVSARMIVADSVSEEGVSTTGRTTNEPESARHDAPAAEPESVSQETIDAAKKAAAAKSMPELKKSLGMKEGEEGDVAEMPNEVMFAFGSDTLRPQSVTILANLAEMIRRLHSRDIRVIGHTDSVGPVKVNFELSKRRALVVSDWLIRESGIPGSEIIPLGLGPDRPKASNDTPGGRTQNRRVEVVMPKAESVGRPITEKQ
jgi:outer membrane protein OmpA-like peptidoglycan-associated protein